MNGRTSGIRTRILGYSFFILSIAACKSIPEEKSVSKDDDFTTERGDLILDATFERPPFITIFASKNGDLVFALVGAHLKPDHAVLEANYLDDVVAAVRAVKNVQDVIVMGDLNLDCSYASLRELKNLDMRAPGFEWLIDDDADTNVAETECAYDRVIVAPATITEYSATIDRSVSGENSDHFPIDVALGSTSLVAYNLQQFGATKSADPVAVEEFAGKICSADIALLQEVIGVASPTSKLADSVDSRCQNRRYVESEPKGTTSYKERYAYFFDSSKFTLLEAFTVVRPDIQDQ